MDATNDAIADMLDQLGTWQEVQGAVPFKVFAYRNAAEELRSLPRPVAAMVRAGEPLTSIEAVGKSMAQRIEKIVTSGTDVYRQRFEAEVGPGIFELLRLPGLGPKRVRQLREQLAVHSLSDLVTACEGGRLRQAEGFGPKTESDLLEHARRALAAS